MKVSTKGRYALRLMIDLGIHKNQGKIALKDISKRENISIKYLEQIVSVLTSNQLIIGARGSQGGYSLTRDPDQYIVGDILRAVEGSMAAVEFLDSADTTKRFWDGLNQVIDEYIDSYTLQDLIDMNEVFTYII